MPTFQFEAMDATGQEIRDVIDAATEEEAQTTIRQMGYFVTKIAVKKAAASANAAKAKKSAVLHWAAADRSTSVPSRVNFRSCKTPACRSFAA